jgi:7-carboxy-7-deazaguanine synthase
MKKNSLIVSESFYSIQGEGQTMGIPAVFLRLAGCNLLCESKDWRCDTIEVWQKGKSTEFQHVLRDNFVNDLKRGAHLVITGGEPLLQQMQIIEYLNWFRATHKFTPIVEVETNGTIMPVPLMYDKIDYWNVSPKLGNSGMPYDKRCNEVALRSIERNGRNKIFKFVVCYVEDWINISDEYGFLDKKNYVLMPAGENQALLNRTRFVAIELCKVMGVRFCDRLHVVAWNKKTGV